MTFKIIQSFFLQHPVVGCYFIQPPRCIENTPIPLSEKYPKNERLHIEIEEYINSQAIKFYYSSSMQYSNICQKLKFTSEMLLNCIALIHLPFCLNFQSFIRQGNQKVSFNKRTHQWKMIQKNLKFNTLRLVKRVMKMVIIFRKKIFNKFTSQLDTII